MTDTRMDLKTPDWVRRLDNRIARLKRLLDMNAPKIIVSNEIDLVREALDGLDNTAGDRPSALQMREEMRSEDSETVNLLGMLTVDEGERLTFVGNSSAIEVSGPWTNTTLVFREGSYIASLRKASETYHANIDAFENEKDQSSVQ